MEEYSGIREENREPIQSPGSNSLPVRERGSGLFRDEDNDKDEIKLYNATRKKEEANEIKRGGRIKEALNWAKVLPIYALIGLALLLVLFFGAAIAAGLFLENGQVYLNRIAAVYSSMKEIIKDSVLTVAIFVFGNKYEVASRVIRNVISD